MERITPYLHLMRLHQPTGIFLLLWPCWWGVALASHGLPSPFLLLLFTGGAIVMRGAGCIVNDLFDRDFDREVERTKHRPLASGVIAPRHAILFLAVLLCIGLATVLLLPSIVFWLALLSLPLVVLYPLMKRVTWWPQAFLGLTFNWGALMGWAAMRGTVDLPALLLYAAGFFWTLGYDTIYAHQDKEDDARIGVKSTARLLGENTRYAVSLFYGAVLLLLFIAGGVAHTGPLYYPLLLPVGWHLFRQVRQLAIHDRQQCQLLFQSNRLAGFLIFIAIVAGVI